MVDVLNHIKCQSHANRGLEQSGTKPKLVAKILAPKNGDRLCMGYQN